MALRTRYLGTEYFWPHLPHECWRHAETIQSYQGPSSLRARVRYSWHLRVLAASGHAKTMLVQSSETCSDNESVTSRLHANLMPLRMTEAKLALSVLESEAYGQSWSSALTAAREG